MQVTGCVNSGSVCIYLGDFAAALQYLERGFALFDPSQRSLYALLGSEDELVALLTLLSFSLAYVGYLDQALSRGHAAIAEARRLSSAASLLFALQLRLDAGWTARRDPRELLHHADEVLALAEEHGFALWRVQAVALRGWCLTALGHAEDGIPLLTTALAEWLSTGAIIGVAHHRTLMADAYRIAGQPHAGFAHLAEAERLAEAGRDRSVLVETLRLRGDLLLLTGDPVGAETSFRDAVTTAREQGTNLWQLRASTSLARLWRDQGKRTEARDLVAPIYNWFTEGFDAPDLVEARTLLAELQ